MLHPSESWDPFGVRFRARNELSPEQAPRYLVGFDSLRRSKGIQLYLQTPVQAPRNSFRLNNEESPKHIGPGLSSPLKRHLQHIRHCKWIPAFAGMKRRGEATITTMKRSVAKHFWRTTGTDPWKQTNKRQNNGLVPLDHWKKIRSGRASPLSVMV